MCFTNPYLFCLFYAISQLLDAVDGNVARALNQGKFFFNLSMKCTPFKESVGLVSDTVWCCFGHGHGSKFNFRSLGRISPLLS
jgi:hypothetical protein